MLSLIPLNTSMPQSDDINSTVFCLLYQLVHHENVCQVFVAIVKDSPTNVTFTHDFMQCPCCRLFTDSGLCFKQPMAVIARCPERKTFTIKEGHANCLVKTGQLPVGILREPVRNNARKQIDISFQAEPARTAGDLPTKTEWRQRRLRCWRWCCCARRLQRQKQHAPRAAQTSTSALG